MEVVAGDAGRARYFLKISTMDGKRLGHDLVRVKWDQVDSDDDGDECIRNQEVSKEYISQTPISAIAKQLDSAASIAGTIPILVLPHLGRDEDHGLFQYLDSINLRYHCRSDPYPIIAYAPGVPTSISPKAPKRRVTLDITTLLSFLADICNMSPRSIEYEKKHCPQVDQIEWETRSPILPTTIYPFLEDAGELITAPDVVSKMYNLLETIGSADEKQRAKILFGEVDSTNGSLIDQYNQLTLHPIPKSVPLPIKIIPIAQGFESPLSVDDLEKLSAEAAEIYNLAISHPEGTEVATANKQLAKLLRLHYFVERNAMGVYGRVLLHQPRSLRGFGQIVHLPMKELPAADEVVRL